MGGSVGASVTFAVCIKCGVQSPPVFIDDDTAMHEVLKDWHFTSYRFSTSALCPRCYAEEE